VVPNTSAYVKTVATETHLAEEQFLLQEQALNKEKSPETNSFQNRTIWNQGKLE
jgi:hypothetical protein